MVEILKIMLDEVKGRLLPLGIGMEVSDSIVDLVCEKGYDRSYGARPLRRAVTSIVEDVVSEALLTGAYKPGDTILIDLDRDSGTPSVSLLAEPTVHLSDATSAAM